MKQAVEFILFMVVAAVAHLALFSKAPDGAAPASGNAGENSISLAASSKALSDLVAKWDRPVDAAQQIAVLEPVTATAMQDQPRTPFAQSQPTRQVAQPSMAPSPSAVDGLPAIDMRVPQPSALAEKTLPRSKERPVRPREPRSSPSTQAQTAPRQTAAGSGQKQSSGNEGAAAAPTKRQSPNPALMAQWGSSIRSSVERRKRYPAGTRNRGTVTVTLAVSASGTLSSVAVQRSSGDATLDQAAVTAVRRARFSAAPRGVSMGVHRFSLPIRFDR